jgi:predicted RNase H-like HicB family nuclease
MPNMKRQKEFSVVIERDSEGYFVASVPFLPGCHTQAKTLDALIKRIKEAIAVCLEVEDAIHIESQFITRANHRGSGVVSCLHCMDEQGDTAILYVNETLSGMLNGVDL